VKILIIDDDEDLRNILARYLKQEWPDIAIEQFDPVEREMPDASFPLGSYDVLILDYMLGRGDGLESSRRARIARRSCFSRARGARSSRCAR
jgi:DNA-binding response OmpR family regulator